MYSYIKGEVVEKGLDYVVVETSGIGYILSVSSQALGHLKLGERHKIFTKFIVKEDEQSLCGFMDENERTCFEHLISVSGIGKRVALGMLSGAPYGSIMEWIITANEKSLSKLPGLGKKTSQRLIVELKDKLQKLYGTSLPTSSDEGLSLNVQTANDDIMLALLGLGFKKEEISRMLLGVDLSTLTVEQAIKYALTHNRN